MKKVAIVLGRGVEGCGVSKHTAEFSRWLNAAGYRCRVLASKEKNYPRKYSHDIDGLSLHFFSRPQEMQEVLDACNLSDCVVVNSLPPKDASAAEVENFAGLLAAIKPPVVLMQHDHNKLSIMRNRCLDEAIARADLILVHSKTNDFAEVVEEWQGDVYAMIAGEDRTKRIETFQPGFNFDAARLKHWKPIEDTDPRHHKWVGRTTQWKGYREFMRFHQEYVRTDPRCVSMMEGIDKSPAFLDFKTYAPFVNHCNSSLPYEEADVEALRGGDVAVFSQYPNSVMLERMSRAGFGYQLSLLKQKYVERSIEYTHAEIAAVGTIPVFRKAFGDICLHRVHGIPLTQCRDHGTIWFDENDMGAAWTEINKLADSPSLRDETREKAFEFYRQHQHSDYVFSEMMDKIKTVC